MKKFVDGVVFGCGFAFAFAAIWTAWSFGMAYFMPIFMESAMTTAPEGNEFSFFKHSANRMQIPPGGGILAMSPMNTAKGSTRPSTYQLWLTDSKLWQIRTVEEKVEMEELPYPANASVADLDKLMRKSVGSGARQSSMTVSADELNRLKSGGGSSRDDSLNGKLGISVEGVVFVQPNPYGTSSAMPVSAKEKCGGSDVKYFDQALAYHLAKREVPHTVKPGGLVCVPERYAADFDAAQNEATNYFHEVALLLKDTCEEHAFAEWATKERLRFDVRPTRNARNEPSGNMFHLRSFTREEVLENREKLASAPKGVTCRI